MPREVRACVHQACCVGKDEAQGVYVSRIKCSLGGWEGQDRVGVFERGSLHEHPGPHLTLQGSALAGSGQAVL